MLDNIHIEVQCRKQNEAACESVHACVLMCLCVAHACSLANWFACAVAVAKDRFLHADRRIVSQNALIRGSGRILCKIKQWSVVQAVEASITSINQFLGDDSVVTALQCLDDTTKLAYASNGITSRWSPLFA